MPGPVIKNPIPSWADSSQNSVFDSPIMNGLRSAGHWLGLDDPNSQVIQVGLPASPLISIYNNAADRAVGTNAFKAAARALHPAVGDAADWFAAKWPRVAAHILPEHIPEEAVAAAGDTGIAALSTPYTKVTEPMPLIFTQHGLDLVAQSPANARNFIAHEGVHGAQALGNKDFGNLYDFSNAAVEYSNNPFEITANSRGTAAMAGTYKPIQRSIQTSIDSPNSHAFTALRGLKMIADNPEAFPDLNSLGSGIEPTDNASYTIDQILQRRAATPIVPKLPGK